MEAPVARAHIDWGEIVAEIEYHKYFSYSDWYKTSLALYYTRYELESKNNEWCHVNNVFGLSVFIL